MLRCQTAAHSWARRGGRFPSCTFWGAVLGAGIVVVLKEILQSYLPVVFHGSAQLEIVIFGILLVALLQAAPGGIWPRLDRKSVV